MPNHHDVDHAVAKSRAAKTQQVAADDPPASAAKTRPRTLAIDIGGTGLKASVLDPQGRMVVDRVRIPTPYPCPPAVMVDALVALVEPLPEYHRVSVGFPGVVRRGVVLTAPHFGDEVWREFPFAETLERRLGHPVKLINDAEMQGFGVISGRGLELVLTLGTGAGTGLFRHGALMPHLELAQHPLRHDRSYNAYIGDAALKRVGVRRWNRRVRRTIAVLEGLLHFDQLYLGGGNAARLTGDLPKNCTRVSNEAGVTGGIALWTSEAHEGSPDGHGGAGQPRM